MLDRTGLDQAALMGRRSRSRRTAGAGAVAAVVLAGLLAAGCGSSSSTTSTAAKPAPTKAQFLAQANAICTQGNKKLAGSEKALGSKPSEDDVSSFITGPLKSEVQRQIDAVRALGAPAGEEQTVKQILDLGQKDLDRVTADPKAFIQAKTSPFHDFAAHAHAYGLTACSEE